MSLPATCSVECLKGRRVPVRGRHAQSMPAIAAAWYATVASLRPPEVDAELVPSLTRTLSASSSLSGVARKLQGATTIDAIGQLLLLLM